MRRYPMSAITMNEVQNVQNIQLPQKNADEVKVKLWNGYKVTALIFSVVGGGTAMATAAVAVALNLHLIAILAFATFIALTIVSICNISIVPEQKLNKALDHKIEKLAQEANQLKTKNAKQEVEINEIKKEYDQLEQDLQKSFNEVQQLTAAQNKADPQAPKENEILKKEIQELKDKLAVALQDHDKEMQEDPSVQKQEEAYKIQIAELKRNLEKAEKEKNIALQAAESGKQERNQDTEKLKKEIESLKINHRKSREVRIKDKENLELAHRKKIEAIALELQEKVEKLTKQIQNKDEEIQQLKAIRVDDSKDVLKMYMEQKNLELAQQPKEKNIELKKPEISAAPDLPQNIIDKQNKVKELQEQIENKKTEIRTQGLKSYNKQLLDFFNGLKFKNQTDSNKLKALIETLIKEKQIAIQNEKNPAPDVQELKQSENELGKQIEDLNWQLIEVKKQVIASSFKMSLLALQDLQKYSLVLSSKDGKTYETKLQENLSRLQQTLEMAK